MLNRSVHGPLAGAFTVRRTTSLLVAVMLPGSSGLCVTAAPAHRTEPAGARKAWSTSRWSLPLRDADTAPTHGSPWLMSRMRNPAMPFFPAAGVLTSTDGAEPGAAATRIDGGVNEAMRLDSGWCWQAESFHPPS